MREQLIKNRGHLFSWDLFDDCGLNLYYINAKNRNYIIDSGVGSGSLEYVKALLEPDKPVILINTHYHWDHIWGNTAIRKATIIAHELCRTMIIEEWDSMLKKNKNLQHGLVQKRLPDIVFDKTLYFPDDGIRLFYTPGHTKDSISILDEFEGVLNCGDNVGDSQEEIVPGIYDEKPNYIESLKSYMSLDFDTVISGHNEVLDKSVISRILNLIV